MTAPRPLSPSADQILRAPAALVALAAVLLFPLPGSAQDAGQRNIDRFEEECHGSADHAGEDESRLSDECFPLSEVPQRPKPLIELGSAFLGSGTLGKGFTLPGGAVWQPAFLAFGTIRTAFQGGTFGGGDAQLAEAVGRLDLFGNLYLTRTERILVGFRPLDEGGDFTGFTLKHPVSDSLDGEFNDAFNATLSTLFFEGDIGELLPNLDKDDSGIFDIYFSVGRQPLSFGDGLLLNDDQLDMVGLTRANMKLGSTINTRVTAVYAWGEIDRHSALGNIEDPDASLFGLFSEIDTRATTLQIDAAVVLGSEASGNGIYASVGDIRRIGRFNNTLRVLGSFPLGDETPFNSQGVLIHEQFSWTPHHSHNFWYIGAFAGIGQLRSAARGPSTGAPTGQTGVLFVAPGIGRLPAILGNNADNAVGASIGHQMFFGHTRQQLLLEVGGIRNGAQEVLGVEVPSRTAAGFGASYRSALGRRFVFVLDGLGNYDVDASETSLVGRLELQVQL